MKKWKILIIICPLIFWGSLGFKNFYFGKEKEDKSNPVVQIKRGTIRVSVTCTGRVVSNQDVEIKSKASGKIIKLPFDISDKVTASRLLVELDPTDEQRNVEKAKADLTASEARLNIAKQELIIAENKLITTKMNIEAEISSTKATWEDAENKAKREEQLYQKKLSSQEELDTRRTEAIKNKAAYEKSLVKLEELKTQEMELELKRHQLQLEESKVRSTRIDLEMTEQRLQDTKILAPINGVVTAKEVQIGQIISSGINNIGGGTTILTLSDLSRIFIIASVDESDIGKIKLRQKADIMIDSYPDLKFYGEIVKIASKGVNISNVVTFEVKIEILGKNKSLLRPEMTANVQIVTAEKSDALLIPDEAIEFSADGPRAKILSSDKKTVIHRPLVLGLESDGVSEVLKGVKEGEQVLVNPGQVNSQWSNSKKFKDQ